MMLRKVSKAEKARQEKFNQKVGTTLLGLGAEKLEDRFFDRYKVETTAGPIEISPMGNWIACRFNSVESAKEVLKHHYASGHRLNPFSGKWNFTDVRHGKGFDGDSSLESLVLELTPILKK